jgi:protein TonB
MSDQGGPNEGRDGARHLQVEEADPSSGVVVRLLIAPVVVTLVLAGGVYWLRMQPPMGAAAREQASTILVHLIPRPDPAPIPTPAPSPLDSKSLAAAEPSPAQDEQEEGPADGPPSPAATRSQTTPAPPVASAATGAASPSRAAIQFQQSLLRHIGRYQRYPAAARRDRMQGTVDTFFAMRRDGSLVDVWVRTSSGQPVLDKAAIEAVERAQPLPPIPPELPNNLTIEILLAFDPP